MKFKPFCILTFILLVIASCDHSEEKEFAYEAKVLGVNIDCGIYEIQFLSKLEEVKAKFGNSPVTGIYIGNNLPEELQEEDLIIQLNCRLPSSNEIGVCTHFGPTYPWVYIVNAKKK